MIDFSVGLDKFVPIGKLVERGDPLLRIHSSNDRDIEMVKTLLLEAFEFSEQSPVESPLILKTFD